MAIEKGETYLGDAVYASFDGYQIRLRTGDAYQQIIYLEPNVLTSLFGYWGEIRKRQREMMEGVSQDEPG